MPITSRRPSHQRRIPGRRQWARDIRVAGFFKAKARTVEGGYRLKVIIDEWRGYGREYDFRYGTSNPGEFHVYGAGGP
jgi:hypothetical protein